MIRYLYKKHKSKKQAREAGAEDSSSTERKYTLDEAGTFADGGKPAGALSSKVESDAEPTSLSNEESKRQKSEARKYRWKLIAGLFFPYFIASTDLTSKQD